MNKFLDNFSTIFVMVVPVLIAINCLFMEFKFIDVAYLASVLFIMKDYDFNYTKK